MRSQCRKCKEFVSNRFAQKEHVIIKHPWGELSVTADTILNRNGFSEKQSSASKNLKKRQNVPNINNIGVSLMEMNTVNPKHEVKEEVFKEIEPIETITDNSLYINLIQSNIEFSDSDDDN